MEPLHELYRRARRESGDDTPVMQKVSLRAHADLLGPDAATLDAILLAAATLARPAHPPLTWRTVAARLSNPEDCARLIADGNPRGAARVLTSFVVTCALSPVGAILWRDLTDRAEALHGTEVGNKMLAESVVSVDTSSMGA